jgi:DUF4097 and DUF4098 domain-containing protein YvlB
MSQERIETNKSPLIHVESCNGDLVIRSWSETAVSIKSSQYDANETEAGLTLSSSGSMTLTIPTAASLTIGAVHGDLVVKRVSGDLSLQTGDGDVILVGLNNIKINTINGDLSAKQLDGDLFVETINGDASCRHVQSVAAGVVNGDISVRFANGSVRLQEINGDAGLRGINGDVFVENGRRDANLREIAGLIQLYHVNGDIRLKGPLCAGDHNCTANGDIVLRWPANHPVTINASAAAIKNRLPLQDVEESATTLSGHLEKGGPVLNLKANGRIILKEAQLVKEGWEQESSESFGFGEDFDFGFAFDFADLGERISREVQQNIERITTDIQSKFGPDFGEKMAEKFARKAERAAAKAEKAAERAQRRAARQQARQTRWSPPPPPGPTKPSPPKSSPEEQIKILKMVEQGILSPEEANTLLEALG